MSKLKFKELGEEDFDDVISDHAQYGRIQFWEQRYANEHEPFEWYFGYEYFRETIQQFIPFDWRVLIAGCGTSNMLGDMVDDGYEQVVGGDFSRVAIAQLKYRYKGVREITYFQGNMTDTDLPDASFGAIIDKALFDSLLCTQTGHISIQQYLHEVERILTDEGVFIFISYGNPEQRLHLIEQYDIDEPRFTPWVVEVQALTKPRAFEEEELDTEDPSSMYFVYICRKTPELVMKKKIKLGKLTKKQIKEATQHGRRANLKPAV